MTNWKHWKHYICINCKSTLKTTVDNPDTHIKCVVCGHSKFDEISKEVFEAKTVFNANNLNHAIGIVWIDYHAYNFYVNSTYNINIFDPGTDEPYTGTNWNATFIYI